MKIKLYQVDAFASGLFSGNPAAVCPLKTWLAEEILQNIANENNLSETAFFVPTGGQYQIRWFTPQAEVDLCGHATLASAFVIFNYLDSSANSLVFQSNSGLLTATRNDAGITLDFPAGTIQAAAAEKTALAAMLGFMPVELYRGMDYLAVAKSVDEVQRCQPDFRALRGLPARGVIITAPGVDCDFVSRFFAPNVGVDEDPVTGSAHCLLAPFWSKRLGQTQLIARQLSKRGGLLTCSVQNDRVLLTGQAVPYMTAELAIEN